MFHEYYDWLVLELTKAFQDFASTGEFTPHGMVVTDPGPDAPPPNVLAHKRKLSRGNGEWREGMPNTAYRQNRVYRHGYGSSPLQPMAVAGAPGFTDTGTVSNNFASTLSYYGERIRHV